LQVYVNGERRDVDKGSIAELIEQLGYTQDYYAVAVDGHHVPRSKWIQTAVADNQEIMILHPMQGG